MELEIGWLGPLVVKADGEELPLPGARLRVLLCGLGLRLGQTVGVEELMELIWGANQPPTAATALQVHISRLRHVLGEGVIVTVPGGYQLNLPDDAIDARRFERSLEVARAALRANDPRRAFERVGEGLRLWRGPALAEVREDDFARAEAQRLDELRLAAQEEAFEAALRLGRHDQVAPQITAALAAEPYRERLHAQLMLALYRCGRQAEALDAYRIARRTLVGELGVDPGPELEALQRAILVQDPSLAGPITTPMAGVGLPAPVTPLLGRSSEVALVTSLLHQAKSRLVTLVGPGGVGKSRLALEVAERLDRELEGGAVWAELGSLDEAGQALIEIARAAGVQHDAVGELREQLAARFAEPTVLIVDGLERIVGIGLTISTLLSAHAHLRVLATSREPLSIRGEHLLDVQPLAIADAVELFVQRAQARGRSIERSAELENLCTRLDALPLAIELVAGHADRRAPRELLKAFERPLDLEGARDAHVRQRSLRSTIAWSVELLTLGERIAFTRLAIFSGGWTSTSASEICDAASATLDALCEKSLVTCRPGSRDMRYGMFDTIRQYALDELNQSGEAETMGARHLEHWISQGEALERARGEELAPWIERLDVERANIRAAIGWAIGAGRIQDAVTLYWSLTELFRARGQASEGRTLAELLLSGNLDPLARLRLHHEAAVQAIRQGNLEAGEFQATQSLELARRLDDPGKIVLAAQVRAILAAERGELDQEALYVDEMLRAAEISGDPRMRAVAKSHVALGSLRAGHWKQAAQEYDELVRSMADLDVMRASLGSCLLNRGLAELHDGQLAAGAASLEQSASIAREIGDLDSLGYILEGYAAVAVRSGSASEAARLQGAAGAALTEAGTVLEAFERAMADQTAMSAISSLGLEQYGHEREAGMRLGVEGALSLADTVGASQRQVPPRSPRAGTMRKGST